ncbi:MAG: guanylate kinase [bacterium]
MPKKAKKPKGLLVVVSGPSGVGKSTVVKRLLKLDKNARISVSATTRKPRPGEVHGEHYYFNTEAEFDKKVKKNDFLEWAKVHDNYYGTLLEQVDAELSKGKTLVCEVDVQGGASIKQCVDEKKVSASAVFIFLIPPSVDILAFRLKKRKTEDDEVVNYRLRAAIAELQVMEKYDYIVVNDKVETAAQKIAAIINVEKERMLLN